MEKRRKFDGFWNDVHQKLDKPVHVTNWTVARKIRFQKHFSAWSGKGSFAQKFLSVTNRQSNSDAVFCETLNRKRLRIIHRTEAEKIYKLWPRYLNRDILRSEIRYKSKNLTYIFGLLHKFENLMFEEN